MKLFSPFASHQISIRPEPEDMKIKKRNNEHIAAIVSHELRCGQMHFKDKERKKGCKKTCIKQVTVKETKASFTKGCYLNMNGTK